MAQELIMVLKETILPMAERLDRDRVVLPGAAGKKPAGRFLPADGDPPAEKDPQGMKMGIGPYGAHSSPLEWVFGFSGRAELALDGWRYVLDRGDLAIVPTEIPHQERIVDRRQPYHLIWFCVYSEDLEIHSSSYAGGNRFRLVGGAGIEGRADLSRVFARGSEEALARGTAWESLLRASVVEALVRVIRHLEEHGIGHTPRQYRGDVVLFAKKYIQEHYGQRLTLQAIARAVYLNPSYFSSFFARSAGITVFDYVRQVRMDEAQRLLVETDLAVGKVAARVGIPSIGHFSRSFKRHNGCTAREFRRRAAP